MTNPTGGTANSSRREFLKRSTVLLLTPTIPALFSSCGGGDDTSPGAVGREDSGQKGGTKVTSVRVPYILPLTGAGAQLGQQSKLGAELAAKVINDSGGIKSLGGAKIDLEFLDAQSKPERAFSLTAELARSNDVPMVVGTTQSGLAITATEAAERARLPFMVDGANDDQITSRGFEYLVNLAAPMSTAAKLCLEALRDISDRDDLNLENVAILIHDDPPGPTALKSLEENVGEYGFNIMDTFRYAETTTDFTPVISQLRELNPDLTIQQSYPQSALLITRTMIDLGYNPPTVCGIMAGHSINNYEQELGENAEGTTFVSYWAPDLNVESSKAFVQHYTEEGHSGDPDSFAAVGYSAVGAASQVYEAAGTLDRDEVLKTMKSLDVEEGAWPVYARPGGIKFDKSGTNVRGTPIFAQWLGGRASSVWPFESAGSELVWPKPAWK